MSCLTTGQEYSKQVDGAADGSRGTHIGSTWDVETRVSAASTRASKWRTAAAISLGFLSALTLSLLGIVIWLGVETIRNKDHIQTLRSDVAEGSTSSLPELATSGGGVVLSTQARQANGYTRAGSLYRGSGYWAKHMDLPVPRSDFDVVVVNSDVYLLGGHDDKGQFLKNITLYNAILDQYKEGLAPMPEPRSRFTAVEVNGMIYVIGGYKDDATSESGSPEGCTLVYDIGQDRWSRAPSSSCLMIARSDACAAVINNKIYIAGGYGPQYRTLDTVEMFDPVQARWSEVGRLQVPAGDVACAALKGQLFLVGGYHDPSGAFKPSSFLSAVQAFDPVTGRTTLKAPLLHPRGDGGLVALPGDRLLLAGGETFWGNRTQVGTRHVEEYSYTADMWVERAPLDLTRFRHGSAYVQGSVYVFGGHPVCRDSQPCAEQALASVESFYDLAHPDVFVYVQNVSEVHRDKLTPPVADVALTQGPVQLSGYLSRGSLHAGSGYWSQMPDLDSPLSDFQALTVGEIIYLAGGMNHTSGNVSADLVEFNTALQQFTNRTLMPEPRYRAAGAVMDGRLYIAGGYRSLNETGGPSGQMMVMDVKTMTWSMSTARLNIPRSDACMEAVQGKMYLAGGYDANYTTLSAVEVFDPNTNMWTLLTAAMPTPRGDVMCSRLGDSLVVLGGYHDPSGKWGAAGFRTEVERFEVKSGSWRSLAPLPLARGDMAVARLWGNRLLAMGGETGVDKELRNEVATHTVVEYLGDYDVWVRKAPMKFGRFRAHAAQAQGQVYIFGGQTTSVCSVGVNGTTDCPDIGLASVETYTDIDYVPVFVHTRS